MEQDIRAAYRAACRENPVASIVLIDLIEKSSQQTEIRKLEKRIDIMRTQIPPINAVSNLRLTGE